MRKSSKNNKVKRDKLLLTIAADRAFSDAIYSHLVDLAYDKLDDPEYQKILDEFLSKTYQFLSRSRNGKTSAKGTGNKL